MLLSQLKSEFEKDLQDEFPSTEILSFFYILTEEYLGMQRVDIALNPAQEISKETQTKFESALNRLKKHEPIQYITGSTEFFTRKFLVNKSVLEDQCQDLNKRFFTFHKKKRPYIILKWAQTQDGYIAPEKRDEKRPIWITNKYSGQLVHKWRSEETAILVGTNTALQDNPSLNVRKWTGSNPTRIVIDRDLKIPKDYSVFDGKQKTIILCSKKPVDSENKNLIFEELDFSENITGKICEVLHNHELQSVIIEGGSHTLQQFIDTDFWDEARIFTGKSHFRKGIKAPEFSGIVVSEETISGDNLKIYRND